MKGSRGLRLLQHRPVPSTALQHQGSLPGRTDVARSLLPATAAVSLSPPPSCRDTRCPAGFLPGRVKDTAAQAPPRQPPGRVPWASLSASLHSRGAGSPPLPKALCITAGRSGSRAERETQEAEEGRRGVSASLRVPLCPTKAAWLSGKVSGPGVTD